MDTAATEHIEFAQNDTSGSNPTQKEIAHPQIMEHEPEDDLSALPPRAGGMLAASASAILAACGGGSDGEAPVSDVALTKYYTPLSTQEAARFLQQAQFTSTKTEIDALMKTNFVDWLNGQFVRKNDSKNHQTLIANMTAKGYLNNQTSKILQPSNYPQAISDITVMWTYWQDLITCTDPVRKRMALALSEFFVLGIRPAETYWWANVATAHYWDLLVKNAFGNFRNLLTDISTSVAMGHYLTIIGSEKEDKTTGSTETSRKPDENYAREIMQLYTIGLYKLNLNGTPKLDGNKKPIPAYTQKDVTELAKVFTGYRPDRPNYDVSDLNETGALDATFAIKPMIVDKSRHDTTKVEFANFPVISATDPAIRLKQALDNLFNHPNVGPFFARQMIQRLVTSNPSPAYVARVAAVFNDNGVGVRGDLKAVWAAILLDFEARAMPVASNRTFGKLREPMLRFLQWARTCGLNSKHGNWKIDATFLGQSPLKSPSVFNFFRPNYTPANLTKTKDPANYIDQTDPIAGGIGSDINKKKINAPEFQIANESNIFGYVNFMSYVTLYGIPCNAPNEPNWVDYWVDKNGAGYSEEIDLDANYAVELSYVDNAANLINYLNLVFAAGQISTYSLTTMVNALNTLPVSTLGDKRIRIFWALIMVMTCAEYAVQK